MKKDMPKTDAVMPETVIETEEDLYRSYFEQALDAIYVADVATGNLLDCNPAACRLVGRDRNELVGVSHRILHPPHIIRNGFCPVFKTHVEGTKAEILKTEILTKTGEIREVAIYGTRFEFRGRKILLGIFRDITEWEAAEAHLQQALEKLKNFEAIVTRSPAVVFLWRIGEGWPVEFVSENIRQFGYTAQELITGAVSWPGITHPEDVPRLEAEVLGYLKRGVREWEQEYRLITQSGEVRWLRDRNMTLAGPSGNITHIQSIVLDVTEQKKMEDSLRQSEAKFRNLVTNLPAVAYQACLDEALTRTYVSPQIEDMLGLSPEQFMSDPGTWSRCLHPQDRERVSADVRESHRSQRAFSMEYRIVHKDGHELWVRDQADLLFDAEGKPVCWQGVVIDITESKKNEASLKENEMKFKALAEQSANMIFINKRGRIVYANRKCEDMGYSREEFYRPDFDFRHLIEPGSRPKVEEAFGRHARGEEVEPYEYGIVKKDGGRIDCIITTRLIDYQGEKAILGIVTDITNRKVAEETLRQSEMKLREQTQELERKNLALKEILEHIEKEKNQIKENVIQNVEHLLLPILNRLKLKDTAALYVDLLRQNLMELVSGFGGTMSDKNYRLSPREIEICNMIKNGLTSKEIAKLLNITYRTVEKHRENIRRKLSEKMGKYNLASFLKSF